MGRVGRVAGPVKVMAAQSPLGAAGQARATRWMKTESKFPSQSLIGAPPSFALVNVVPVAVKAPFTVMAPPSTLTKSPVLVVSAPSTVRPPSSTYPKWSAGTAGRAGGAPTAVASQVKG